MEMTEAERYAEERRLQDLKELEDDPVLESPNKCSSCGALGSQVPIIDHAGERFCDPCWVKSVEYGKRRLCDCEYQDEVFFEFNIRIGVKVPNRSKLTLLTAKLRASEILLGMPMADDQETWEQEYLGITNETGDVIELPEGDAELADT